MAMFVETTRDHRAADATTLEEAAEELLNGLLCHYEPPDPQTIKKMQAEAGILPTTPNSKKSRGILRASRLIRSRRSKNKNNDSNNKTVRWEDEHKKKAYKTPDMYDIREGCRDAVTECASSDCGDLAAHELSQERENSAKLNRNYHPKTVGKRVHKHRLNLADSEGDESQSDSTILDDGRGDNRDSKNNRAADPVSLYRDATKSPRLMTTPEDTTSSLFDDEGNIVGVVIAMVVLLVSLKSLDLPRHHFQCVASSKNENRRLTNPEGKIVRQHSVE